jgi:hypothetical protein
MSQIQVTLDTETFPNCFLLVGRICDTEITFSFEISDFRDDGPALYSFLCFLRSNGGRAYGFNLVGFDGPIIHMFMRMGGKSTARQLYDKAMSIIHSQDDAEANSFQHMVRPSDRDFEWVCLFRINHFHNRARSTSLKMLEFVMRMDNIEDLPFPVGINLSQEQIKTLKDYCLHDVKATEQFRLKCMGAVRLREELSVKYGRDMMNHDDVKIGSTIFEIALENAGVQLYDYGPDGRKPKQTKRPSIALKDVILSNIAFQQPEFTRILDWLKSQVITQTKGVFEDVTALVGGFEFVFGLGGIHGAVESEVFESDDEWVIESRDVASYYPNLSIKNRFYPLHLGEKFCEVYENLFDERKRHPKGSSQNAAYKLALNGTYGKSNDAFSPFFDPAFTMMITLNGQLQLSMLAENLLRVPTLKLIMINTDGMEYRVKREYVQVAEQVCDWWQKFTRLTLEGARYKTLFVRDVNNYIGVFEDGSVKRKGAYEYDMEWHQNHSALVVAKVAEKVLVDRAPIRETVENWPDIMDFMLRAKVPRSSKLMIEHAGVSQQQLQNTTRYYVAKGGGQLIKVMPPLAKKPDVWRRIGIESGWGVQPCNDIRDAGKLPVDFDYYVKSVEKLVLGLK